MGLRDKTEELTREIMKTNEFSELMKAKKEIDKDRNLKRQMDNFTKRQMDVFSSNRIGKDTELKLKQLNNEFESLSKVPQVSKFLQASKDFNNILQKTYKQINSILDKEINS